MRDIEADALNASMNSIVEACIFLVENGNILLGKREGGERLPFDLQKQSDEGYLSNFFGRGSFELKVTHQGRKRLEENEENRSGTAPQREKVPTQKSLEAQKSDEASNKKASAPKEEIPQTAEDVSTLEFRLRELSENALFYFDSATGLTGSPGTHLCSPRVLPKHRPFGPSLKFEGTNWLIAFVGWALKLSKLPLILR